MKNINLTDKEIDLIRTALLKDAKVCRESASVATKFTELQHFESEAAFREALEARFMHLADGF